MLCTRAFQPGEKQQLYALLDHPDPQIRRRTKAVLLSAEGPSANQLVPRVNLTAKSIRKWLTRFNSQGVEALTKQPKSPGRKPTFTPAQRQQMVQLALTQPQSLGKPFTTWSLDKLVTHLREHEKIRISKSWLTSPDPEYQLKKNRSKSSCKPPRPKARSSSSTRSGRRR